MDVSISTTTRALAHVISVLASATVNTYTIKQKNALAWKGKQI
ncbi:hypothetical protein QN372_17340 [Undibacterium sp. RTI2.1]|nr:MULTISPECIES: hypothetical protein [unclassified Undibacterium]MDY7538362.1 hypothetical protein [Undibacterium sp. 5I1]MEB0032519.1 hypothetical protein [Undibacterium sp. RTI2.1]MEB0115014.1 hypothetical protein [Undibacterium sp. RTI2.2]MEB0229363.1 hypothetical protein [Undibacterium sp. 10I3]MEB0255973.1 hypothetical protein [Undibacterium sp. 5I1]